VLVAAAVCPHPPLLDPRLAGGAAAEMDDLRAACDDAVAALLEADPQVVVLVGGGPRTETVDGAAAGSLARFGGPRTTDGEAAADRASDLPLSLTIGGWLLERVGYRGPCRRVSLADDLAPQQCAAVGRQVTSGPDRCALLALGDGAARHGERAPGFVDDRSAAFDARVAQALADADPEALLAIDPRMATELMAAGRAPWQALAGAATGATWDGRLLRHEAPYGVGYFVARWTPRRSAQ
jgi:hypothetical protein